MSFLELLFPDYATARHLRTLDEKNRTLEVRQRVAHNRSNRLIEAKSKKANSRIEQLEQELGQASLVIEALIEKLEEKSLVSREELERLVTEIDARDGVIDGRITPTDSTTAKEKATFHFPEA